MKVRDLMNFGLSTDIQFCKDVIKLKEIQVSLWRCNSGQWRTPLLMAYNNSSFFVEFFKKEKHSYFRTDHYQIIENLPSQTRVSAAPLNMEKL